MTNDNPTPEAYEAACKALWKHRDSLAELIALADAVLDHADAHCRAFPIETCKTPTYNLIWDCEEEEWVKGRVYFLARPERYSHWTPLPPPPSNPPLPAVFTELGAALERLKEGR